jgi:hypothetical protein
MEARQMKSLKAKIEQQLPDPYGRPRSYFVRDCLTDYMWGVLLCAKDRGMCPVIRRGLHEAKQMAEIGLVTIDAGPVKGTTTSG